MKWFFLLAIVFAACTQPPYMRAYCSIKPEDVPRHDALFKSCMQGGLSAGIISGDGAQSPYRCRDIVTEMVQTCEHKKSVNDGWGHVYQCDSVKTEKYKKQCAMKMESEE